MALKFLIFPFLQMIALTGFMLGGNWVWLGGGVFAFAALVCDRISDDSEFAEMTEWKPFGMPIIQLCLLLHAALIVAFLWLFLASGAATLQIIGAVLTLGLFIGACGGNIGHELIHRREFAYRLVAEILFALCLHSAFTVEHVYGHHKNAGYALDPATARRGENFWRFVFRSALGANINSWKFEADHMDRADRSVIGWRNRCLRGHVFEAVYLAIVFTVAGAAGLASAVVIGAIAITLIESFNYIAHYGLVRTPGQPFEARHAWNSPRVISSGFTFNITHHARHHMQPNRPYWELDIDHKMPLMPRGPSVLAFIALFPPIWFRFIEPHLARWDAHHASAAERKIVATGSY